MSLSSLSVLQAIEKIKDKTISIKELVKSIFFEIRKREDEINAFLYLKDEKEIIKLADRLDNELFKGGNIGALYGIPVCVKDNLCTTDMPTTCASKILSNFMPPYNATVVEKLISNHAILIGKTNMDEFGMGSSTENSAYKITRNPVNTAYVPGGTSGGSAAAVASNMSLIALGSDTGGSLRQPAGFCGVVGFKPTYGRVSRYGLIAYASSLDHVGLIGKNVPDTSFLFDIIKGKDEKDATSYNLDAHSPLPGKKHSEAIIGVPTSYFKDPLDVEVKNSIYQLISMLSDQGHKIVEIDLKHSEYAVPAYYIISCAEASSNLARYDGTIFGHRTGEFENLNEMMTRSRNEGFGAEVKRRIILGAYVLSSGYYDAYYRRAARVRKLIQKDFVEALNQCDFIIHPIAPSTAFKIGEKTNDPLEMYLVDIYSVIANMIGFPAITIPCGHAKSKLPISVQLLTRSFEDENLLSFAAYVEDLLKTNNAG